MNKTDAGKYQSIHYSLFPVKQIPKPAELIKVCSGEVDIGFILDASVSLNADLSREKQYIKRLLKRFEVSKSGARAGLVSFADKATLNIKLSDYDTLDDFADAVSKTTLKNSLNPVRIDKALRAAYTQLFSEKNGARRNAPQLIILLTASGHDGQDSVSSKDVSAIHEAGIKVIVLGIGSAVNHRQIADIGKNPENIFFLKDFKELSSEEFVKMTSVRACLNTGKTIFSFIFELCFDPGDIMVHSF